ncbi:MAG: hypothetical protein ABIE23_05770 [archaeon]
MKKILLIFFLLLCCSLVSAAHATLLSVHGYLMDSATGEGMGGTSITLQICTTSACSTVLNTTNITTDNSTHAKGNFDALLDPVQMNYNQEYWLREKVGATTIGTYQFKGGQGQIGPEDVNPTSAYTFGNVTAGSVFVGSSNEIRSSGGALWINRSVGNGLIVSDGSAGMGSLSAGNASLLATTVTSLNSSGNVTVNGKVSIGAGSPTEKLEVSGNIRASGADPTLILQDSGNDGSRPSIKFINNQLATIQGNDTVGNPQIFGFYSKFGSTRTNDAEIQVFGSAAGSWGKYISMGHDGTDGTIKTDTGNIIIQLGS